MHEHTKVATCSYCSARTMLVPSARDGHELACGSCGAPLHEMKWLKTPTEPGKKPKGKGKRRKETGYIPGVHGPETGPVSRGAASRAAHGGYRKKKRKKPLWEKALGEAVDLIEDIFD
ncbi:hypothetical protein [Dinoroseobacter sp. S124A]|uniref:hypothetical protein n=1 Tax=Dinoroseobacter sp. S124A TaxID=3415128 RepID=UPI003C7BEF0E